MSEEELRQYCKDASDEIIKLGEENAQLKKRVDMYENPEDLTLMFMYCDEKAKDKIKHLESEKDDFIKAIIELTEEIVDLKSVLKEIREKINFYKTTEWGLRGHSILETFEEIINKGIGE